MNLDKIKGNKVILMPFNAISVALSVVLRNKGYEVSFFDNNDEINGKTFHGCQISAVDTELLKTWDIIVCSYRSMKGILAQLSGLHSALVDGTELRAIPYNEIVAQSDFDLLLDAFDTIPEESLKQVSKAHYEIIHGSGKQSIRAGLLSDGDNDCIINQLSFIITELCTLRCKDCADWMPYFSNPQHYTLQRIIDGLKNLLEASDCLLEVGVQGGEPLIHKSITEIVNTLCESKKVGRVNLVTNGTLIPKTEFLQSVNKFDHFCVRISDYGSLSAKKKEVKEICQINNVNCVTLSDMTWYYGPVIMPVDKEYSDVKVKYANCQMVCCGLAENLFSKCQNALFAHLLKAVPPDVEGEESIIDVCADDFSKEKLKRHLESTTPLKACWVCSGKTRAGSVIPTAVQTNKFTPYKKYD